MRIFTSNRRVTLGFVLSLLIFFSFTSIGIIFAMKNIPLSFKNEKNNSNELIIIDAGHGGLDGGAVIEQKNGPPIVEKNINLKIALKLCSFCKILGKPVFMLREDDKSIHDHNAKTTRQKKHSDLKNRVEMIKQHSEEGRKTIMISIHQNKFPDKKYHGTQLFYSENNPLGEILANDIHKPIISMLQPDNKREIKPSSGLMYILKGVKIPAVIVECGFLSNEEECKKLLTDEYQGKMAFSILIGIINFLNKKD